MSTLKDKIDLVTGAPKGIGVSIAKHFGAAGATIAIDYSAKGRSGQDRCPDRSGRRKSHGYSGTYRSPGGITRTFAEIKEKYDRLDILVNNAGIYSLGPVEDVTSEEFHRQFARCQ